MGPPTLASGCMNQEGTPFGFPGWGCAVVNKLKNCRGAMRLVRP